MIFASPFVGIGINLARQRTILLEMSLMEVDDSVPCPSNLLASTSPPQQPTLYLPEEAIRMACQKLERIILPDDEDDDIRERLDSVWISVHRALSQRPDLKGAIADEEEFKANVNRRGEERFIALLRHMARKKSWRDLLDNGIHPPFEATLQSCPLSRCVFQAIPRRSINIAARIHHRPID
jgi:hypothetical protein